MRHLSESVVLGDLVRRGKREYLTGELISRGYGPEERAAILSRPLPDTVEPEALDAWLDNACEGVRGG